MIVHEHACSSLPPEGDRPPASERQFSVAEGYGSQLVSCDFDCLSVTAGLPAPGVAVVRAVGEIDSRTAARWAWFLARAVQGLASFPHRHERGDGSCPPPRLVCDLSGVVFLGARGLGALVEADEQAAKAGVGLRLVVATRAVRRVLELTSLADRWPVHDQLLDAIRVPGNAVIPASVAV